MPALAIVSAAALTAFQVITSDVPRGAIPEACVASTILCGHAEVGELGPSDCNGVDGTYLDAWNFAGAAGTIVTLELTPLDSTLTNPVLILVPPHNRRFENTDHVRQSQREFELCARLNGNMVDWSRDSRLAKPWPIYHKAHVLRR